MQRCYLFPLQNFWRNQTLIWLFAFSPWSQIHTLHNQILPRLPAFVVLELGHILRLEHLMVVDFLKVLPYACQQLSPDFPCMLQSRFVQHLLCYLFYEILVSTSHGNELVKLYFIPVTAQNCSICSLVTAQDLLFDLALFSLPLWDLLRLDFEDEPREESSDKSIANI